MFVIENDLLKKEWDKNKNEKIGLDPTNLVVGSNKYAFWKCSGCGHEWKAQIVKRGVRGQGCPVCANKKSEEAQNRLLLEKIKEVGSLGTNYPELVKEWDSDRNEKTPFDYLPKSNKYVFWKCRVCGEEWRAQIVKRSVRGQGCPVCGKEKLSDEQERRNVERIKREGSLGLLYPELISEWDFDKNEKTPFDYLPKSQRNVNWKCSVCGYKWSAVITNRTSGVGCPQCGRQKSKESLLRRLISERGSLADNAPDIASEWDYEKNEGLKPEDVMSNTNKSVWWNCKECGYSWKTSIYNRTSGSGCPKCGIIKQGITYSKPIEGVNDLLSQAPALAKELHPTKNGILTAKDLARSSQKKVWWLGPCGHEWQAIVASRFSGRGCPLCLKEFKISYPEKVIFYYLNNYLPCKVEENYKSSWLKGRELDIYIPSLGFGIEYDGCNWHKDSRTDEEKNRLCYENDIDLLRIREVGTPNIDFDNVYYINASTEKDSELEKALVFIFSYIENKYGVHSFYKIDLSNDRSDIYELMQLNRKENSLAFLYPDISKEWNQNKNGKITPEYVNAHSHRKYWWICPVGHEYEMEVKHRVEKESKCPICSNHRILEGVNDLASKRPDLVSLWDYVKNENLLPSQVMEFSNKKVWWKCSKGHSYQRVVAHQADTNRSLNCPVCKMQILQSGINDLETLFPDVAKEWDYETNGDFLPNMFTPISNKKFNWICKECGWRWNISINSRCVLGHGCPKCAGKKRWAARKNKKS